MMFAFGLLIGAGFTSVASAKDYLNDARDRLLYAHLDLRMRSTQPVIALRP